MPVSVTHHDGLVYVLNAAGAGSISGFWLDEGGRLTAIPDSTRPLSGAEATAAAQVQFSPYGDSLVVTERATNLIDVYLIGEDGLPGAPIVNPSAGQTPFGFAFTQDGLLVVSEAFGGGADASATSSYDINADGTLQVISASIGTTESAACWVAIPPSGRFAYVTNTGSDTVSGYSIDRETGELELLDEDGVTAVSGDGPIDAAFSRNGSFLYTLDGRAGQISGFAADRRTGALSAIEAQGGLPAGANGLAAR
jgi:6-phosphogluconolactonase (cycloisomerase 2 family)